jgi:transposase
MSGHQPVNKTPPEKERLIVAAVQSGLSIPDAGRAYGVSPRTVRAALERNGAWTPPRGGGTLPPERLEKLRKLLVETAKPYVEIAAEMKMGRATVRKYARDFGATHVREVNAPGARKLSPEREILITTLLISGMPNEQIARKVGCHVQTVYDVRARHRETIEAAREPDAPAPVAVVAKPACHVERWIAEGFDPIVARFMASNRLRLLRVSEGV